MGMGMGKYLGVWDVYVPNMVDEITKGERRRREEEGGERKTKVVTEVGKVSIKLVEKRNMPTKGIKHKKRGGVRRRRRRRYDLWERAIESK